MLKNSGFEAEWNEEESHMCTVCKPDGTVEDRVVDNIFTPPGWRFWFYHDPGKYDQPEGRDSWKVKAPDRVRSGEKAYMWFTFNRAHYAGLMQQVDGIEVGAHVKFCAWMHAWSNGYKDGPHNDDPAWSEGAGYKHIAWREGSLPRDTGDQQEDAKPNFTFTVGVDPTGGTDPMSDKVVWGVGYHIYNSYCQRLSVEAIAESDQITVFIRSQTLWQFKHSDVYVDDAELLITDVENPELPPEEPARGLPRAQYERTYVLLPPDADSAWAEAVVDSTWDRHRYTVGGSADDAGIGALDARTVIAVNPDHWPGDQTLLDFFSEYYPGVFYVPVHVSTPDELREILSNVVKITPTPTDSLHLSMRDPRWADYHYKDGQCDTIGAQGCWLTVCAMALRWYDLDAHATPITVDQAIGTRGYSGCEMTWDAMHTIGLSVVGSVEDEDTVHAHLAGGDAVFAEVQPGTAKHFIMVTENTGGRYWCYDPLASAPCWLDERYSTVESWRLIAPLTKQTTTLIGINDPEAQGAGDWMVENSMQGILYIPLAIGLDARKLDFTPYADHGIDVYINLRHSWASADGGAGTLPLLRDQPEFETACIETIRQSTGVKGWSLTNEANSPREWPVQDDDTEPITIARLAAFFDTVAESVPAGTLLSIGGLDPFNVQSGTDPREWTRSLWRQLKQYPGYVDVHGYIRGPDVDLIGSSYLFSDPRMQWQYLNYPGCIVSLLEVIPAWAQDLPVICSEFDHIWRTDEGDDGWVNDERAGNIVTRAASVATHVGLSGLVVYRWQGDAWAVHDNEHVKRALLNAR